MSSDAFERVFKLWVSLWTLVLNDNRHLEAVCTALQKLVFEFQGYPKFRNWSAICEVEDWCLKMVLAHVNLESDEGKRLQTAFPECFSYNEALDRIPVSVLTEWSRSHPADEGADQTEFWEVTGTLEHFNIPYSRFSLSEHNRHDPIISEEEYGAMGEGMEYDWKDFGKVVQFRSHQYFVAEVIEAEHICLVPVEVLTLDK